MLIFVARRGGGGGGTLRGMGHHNQIVGRHGERVAARHLIAQGQVLLDRNWRGPAGEVDLVARDGPDVVFVEVKTRLGTRFGTPAEAVVGAKARRLRKVAAQWLAAHAGGERRQVRFDVVSVRLGRRASDGPARVEHLRGAF